MDNNDMNQEFLKRANDLATDVRSKIDAEQLPIAQELIQSTFQLRDYLQQGQFDKETAGQQIAYIARLLDQASDLSGDEAPMIQMYAGKLSEQYFDLWHDVIGIPKDY